MRARSPDQVGTVERAGASIHYEVFENHEPTLLLAPTWQIVHSRHWKMQTAYLARHYRVVTYDPVGNGASSRSTDPDRYAARAVLDDLLAVLDASGTATCVAVGLSMGGGLVTSLAALHPERVDAVVAIAAAHTWSVPPEERRRDVRWRVYDPEYWRTDWRDFVEFFFGEACSDPHSTKLWDDTVGWSLETTGEVIATAGTGPDLDHAELESAVRAIEVPVLLIHGTGDRIISHTSSETLREMIPHAELLTIDGAGHLPTARYPVRVNHAIRDFVDRVHGVPRPEVAWHIGHGRPHKVLYLSSPIGLGHARRDVAIAAELRALHPGVQIDWLAQDPVTRVLEGAGETIHPASGFLTNESAHIESVSGEHDLAAFQALREMDEIQLANFMVMDDVLRDGQYDLVVGDEAWEMDYHLHENPGLKKTAYAWLTDFVGYLPMPERGEREALVAADYNAEMIEQVARYGRVRDAAIFVGNPEDIVPGTFGPSLPGIREWTEANFDFSGYVTGFDPRALGDRSQVRRRLGYHDDERLCVVSVGGSAVGLDLLRRVANAFPALRRAVDGLRMLVVTGPRIDPGDLPVVDGVEYRPYVHELYRHLAVADVAVVQGGLTTTMELTACKVPFLYVPLRQHFEQNFHVRARLEQYRAGTFLPYEEVLEDNLAALIPQVLGQLVDYADVETDGAARAAATIGALLS